MVAPGFKPGEQKHGSSVKSRRDEGDVSDEYESYEIWIAKRTGGATSAQMAAGIINDSKTVLKKLTVSGVPRPGFDNRFVIWQAEDADKPIVNIGEGQTEADGPIFVLDWLALHDNQAKQYAPEIEREQ